MQHFPREDGRGRGLVLGLGEKSRLDRISFAPVDLERPRRPWKIRGVPRLNLHSDLQIDSTVIGLARLRNGLDELDRISGLGRGKDSDVIPASDTAYVEHRFFCRS